MAYTTINNGEDYFKQVIYTGNGTDANSITGVGFQPDFVWLKGRSVSEHHTLNDSVRGANKQLYSHLTYDEATDTDRLQSFDSDGFTLGTDVVVNQNSQSFASWNWYTGGSSASNTDGTITSTIKVNTTAGISIGTYTGNGTAGATVGHGLGAAPDLILIKDRADPVAHSWAVFHSKLGGTKALSLNENGTPSTNAVWFNNTSPTSSVFSVGSSGSATNSNGYSRIFYAFTAKKGFSKMSEYTGNGNTSGPFVYTGFKPAFLLIKCTTATEHWNIPCFRNEDLGFTNGTVNFLSPNLINGVRDMDQNPAVDFLSNGFRILTSDANLNTNGGNYLYYAIAQHPFVSSTGTPVTAR